MTAANVTVAADVTWAIRGDRAHLLMPGQTAFFSIGTRAASVSVTNNYAAANIYILADGILSLIDDKLGYGKFVTAPVAFVTELTDVLEQYHECATGASLAKRLAVCNPLLLRNVTFAFGRFIVGLGKSAISKGISLVVSAAKQWNFTLHLNGEINAIENGQRTISVRALTPACTPPIIGDLHLDHFQSSPPSPVGGPVVWVAIFSMTWNAYGAAGTAYFGDVSAPQTSRYVINAGSTTTTWTPGYGGTSYPLGSMSQAQATVETTCGTARRTVTFTWPSTPPP